MFSCGLMLRLSNAFDTCFTLSENWFHDTVFHWLPPNERNVKTLRLPYFFACSWTRTDKCVFVCIDVSVDTNCKVNIKIRLGEENTTEFAHAGTSLFQTTTYTCNAILLQVPTQSFASANAKLCMCHRKALHVPSQYYCMDKCTLLISSTHPVDLSNTPFLFHLSMPAYH